MGRLKTSTGTLPTLIAWGGVAETGAVEKRQSTFSDPSVFLTLWVKFPGEHRMCAAITGLTTAVTGKRPFHVLAKPGRHLCDDYDFGHCLSSTSKQPEPCLTKNRLQKYI